MAKDWQEWRRDLLKQVILMALGIAVSLFFVNRITENRSRDNFRWRVNYEQDLKSLDQFREAGLTFAQALYAAPPFPRVAHQDFIRTYEVIEFRFNDRLRADDHAFAAFEACSEIPKDLMNRFENLSPDEPDTTFTALSSRISSFEHKLREVIVRADSTLAWGDDPDTFAN